MDAEKKELLSYVFLFIFALISLTIGLFLFNELGHLDSIKEYKTDKEIAIENEYTAYFDGQEIDLNKIDLNQYEVSVDHEKETVYITYKQKRNSSMYPVFIPYKY